MTECGFVSKDFIVLFVMEFISVRKCAKFQIGRDRLDGCQNFCHVDGYLMHRSPADVQICTKSSNMGAF